MIFLVGILGSCSKKEPSLESLISHLRKDFSNEHFSIAPSMASVFIDETLPGGSELKALMDDLTSMEVIVISPNHGKADKGLDLFKIINRRLRKQDLTLLGQFRSEKETVDVWIVKIGEITDLMVVNQSESYLYLVHFKGTINEDNIRALLHPENRPILEYLYRLKAN
ncbi:DUF4252 domain-containing protein [Williamwhitmania taraxaci]|uniref:DUF4252 domain-containing protein n=1 Tax=Williamwhitmania taraxaci TaxID=1640674 RepID=UPI00147FE47D|nr:DUF4252 domain-containing protein [Williamwhitmania taraxaci]